MSVDSLLALLGIVMASAWTPGPNNMMLAASGVNYGLRATAPHIFGVFLGFGFMIFSISLGLGGVFIRYPILHEILRWGGALMLIWVAWKIATAKRPGEAGAATKPFTLIQAAAFQWINPKAWIMCISISSQFLNPENPVASAATIAAISMFGGATSATGWAWFGMILARWLHTSARLRAFNWSMAAIILAGVLVVIFGGL
ncbi:MAG: LysE family transporter [Rhodobacteraceae bacterium]|nr:LysE family transporter [Paracoccaceae bacterium]